MGSKKLKERKKTRKKKRYIISREGERKRKIDRIQNRDTERGEMENVKRKREIKEEWRGNIRRMCTEDKKENRAMEGRGKRM